jgi:phospholipid/cholesterol/gamma-HCH transport system ATP-binding protein
MTAPAIRLDAVTKRFDGRAVLDRVSLTVPPGQAFCLLGRSGTGKSVTLRHIIGLIPPDEGHVFVEEHDITKLGREALAATRKRVGFLFQNAALFDSMSVRENVAFPLRRHTPLDDTAIEQRVRAKLASVGLERDIDKMPADLSGGMRKRVGLARAMALDPAILLVDEPSAGLDPITAREIDELLVAQKRSGTTLVVVTHNIPSARLVGDTLGLLHEGCIVAQGTADDLDRSDHPVVRAFMRSEGGG